MSSTNLRSIVIFASCVMHRPFFSRKLWPTHSSTNTGKRHEGNCQRCWGILESRRPLQPGMLWPETAARVAERVHAMVEALAIFAHTSNMRSSVPHAYQVRRSRGEWHAEHGEQNPAVYTRYVGTVTIRLRLACREFDEGG